MQMNRQTALITTRPPKKAATMTKTDRQTDRLSDRKLSGRTDKQTYGHLRWTTNESNYNDTGDTQTERPRTRSAARDTETDRWDL